MTVGILDLESLVSLLTAFSVEGERTMLPQSPGIMPSCLSPQFRVGAGPVLFDASVSVPPVWGVYLCACLCVLGRGSAVEVVSLIRCVGMCRDVVSGPETCNGLVPGFDKTWEMAPFSSLPQNQTVPIL